MQQRRPSVGFLEALATAAEAKKDVGQMRQEATFRADNRSVAAVSDKISNQVSGRDAQCAIV